MVGRRMLVVDDDSVSRQAMERIFRRKGWEVILAETVAAALVLLDPPPDCVVLDLMLPDGDGEAVLKRVRDGRLPTRVVVTTGCDDEKRLLDVSAMRPQALLKKPIDLDEVCVACG